MKYYLDTCIWRDYFENRSDKFRPLGEWALKLINKIVDNNELVLYSELIEEELKIRYDEKEIAKILSVINDNLLIKIGISLSQIKEAKKMRKNISLPFADILHAILARDNNAVIVTRDKHFLELDKICSFNKPEELI